MTSVNDASKNIRGLLQATFFFAVCVWQTFPALVGLMLYILLIRVLRIDWRWLSGIGAVFVALAMGLVLYEHRLDDIIETGWHVNLRWWYYGLYGSVGEALQYSFSKALFFTLAVPFPMVGMIALMELIPRHC